MRAILSTIAVLALAGTAHAFCGFYVAGAESELFNDATMVVMMRDGTTTVLSMQNDYRGPTEDFAMVVPVPEVLDESDVKTLPNDVFDRVDTLASPRLVEYWEQDPCPELGEGTIGLGNLGTIGHGAGGGGSGYGRGAGSLQVRIEAQFAVGEYEIVILSAEDSSDLDTWLRQNGYSIPEGAAEALRPYVESGMKFFVAKVDASKVTFEDGRAVLSPLRIRYTSDEFSLPVRLGMLNSSGTQDLIVHVLARNQRYELANYPNVTIPTNIDVADQTRERFGEFYAALFDQTLEANPGAVVTEYSWQATGCDPCPGPVLDVNDLATLGADALGDEDTVPMMTQLRPGSSDVTGALSKEVIRRVVRRHINEVRFCSQSNPSTRESVVLEFTIGADGAVTRSSVAGEADGLSQCIARAVRRWGFPQPESGTVSVRYPFTMQQVPMRGAGPFQSFVLTRLHYRYGRGGLGEDLVFRPATPIVGGREWPVGEDGKPTREAQPGTANNFQGRYAIRHAWEGEITCDNPRRGVWGGPPEGSQREPVAAKNTARAPRGGLQLGSFVRETIPSIGLTSLGTTGAGGTPDPETPAAEEPEQPTETPAAATSSGGCGGCSASPRASGLGLFLLALAMVLRRRR